MSRSAEQGVPVAELHPLRAGHAPAVLAFELANRSYFAASISDRGDAWFERFADGHRELLARQDAGVEAYYLVVDEDGSVLGRCNLYRIEDGTAEVGYRIAERAAGRGVATAAVLELCRRAGPDHGLHTLRAKTTLDNVASQTVLTRAGFLPVGKVGEADVAGTPGTWYERSVGQPPA